MKVLYSDQNAVDVFTKGIFLAGPTPRENAVPSWRPTAIEILKESGFDGTVLVPERSGGWPKATYDDQVEWERYCLTNARVITFWVPRNMINMPALTTNVEFGYWLAKSPERVLYGRPRYAPSTRYLDWLIAQEQEEPVIYEDLKDLLYAAVEKAGE